MNEGCVQLDGCCVTHSPCFLPENADIDDGSFCAGWPCPRPTDSSAGASDAPSADRGTTAS